MTGKKKLFFGAIGLISAVTLVARIFGFGRWLTQMAWVGTGEFANAYATANQIPTVLFEVVAGGALAGVTIPLLSAPIAKVTADPSRENRAEVSRITSALLNWGLLLLTPVGVAVFFLAPYIATLLPIPTDADQELQFYLISTFLRMFAWQMPLYGICVVLNGVLQAHERFLLPALGPLLNSLVVISSYGIFALMNQGNEDPWSVSYSAIAIVGWGTTAGVAAMSLPLLVPVWRLGIRIYPTLELGSDLGKRALQLGAAGIGALIAQQVSVLVVLAVARAYGPAMALPIYQYAQAVFTLPYAVLAVPIATAMFPRLSAHIVKGNQQQFQSDCAASTRIVIVAGMLAGALLFAEAIPVAEVFGQIRPVPGIVMGLITLAPAVVGYGLLYHVTRVLYALSGAKAAVLSASLGWGSVCLASPFLSQVLVSEEGRFLADFSNRIIYWVNTDALLSGVADSDSSIAAVEILSALGLAQSLGMWVAAVALIYALARLGGSEAINGIGRITLVSAGVALLSAAVAFGVGAKICQMVPGLFGAVLAAIIIAMICVGGVGVIFVAEFKKWKRAAAVNNH